MPMRESLETKKYQVALLYDRKVINFWVWKVLSLRYINPGKEERRAHALQITFLSTLLYLGWFLYSELFRLSLT